MAFTALNDYNGAQSMTPDAMEDSIPSPVKVKQEENTENAAVSTPRKRGRKKQTMPADSDLETDDVDTPSKKKTKSPGKKGGAMGPIPTTYDEAGAEDKLVIRMKEGEGKTWAEIRKALEEITGTKLGKSTAQVRYARMKANFVVFEKDDEPRLLRTKKEIEERFETEKWQKIADGIEAMGGNKYPSVAVQKKFKEMAKKINGNDIATSLEE